MAVDKEILVGFIEETKSYIPRILGHIETLSEDSGNREAAVEEAYRFIHTIKGASSMLGLFSLSHISYFMEQVLEEIKEGQIEMNRESALFLSGAACQINNYVNDLLSGRLQERSVLSEVVKSFRRLRGLPESGDGEAIDRLMVDVEDLPSAPEETKVWEFDKKQEPENLMSEISDYQEAISPELMEVFFVEVREHLQNITHSLSELHKNSGNKEQLQEVRRCIHTIKGAAGMVGFQSISKLAAGMEDLLDKLYDGDMEPSPEIMNLLFSTSDLLDDIVSGGTGKDGLENRFAAIYKSYDEILDGGYYRDAGSSLEVFKQEVQSKHSDAGQKSGSNLDDEWTNRDEAYGSEQSTVFEDSAKRHIQPEAAPPELLEVFIIEANEHLHNITQSLSKLDNNKEDKNQLQEVRRSVHTIKGAAGMVGFQPVSQLAHRMEDLLDKLYDGGMELSPEIMNLLFTTSDTLDDMVSGKFTDQEPESRLQKLYDLYSHLLERKQFVEPGASENYSIKEEKLATTGEDKAISLSDKDSQVVEEVYMQPDKDAGPATGKPGDFVRIPIERLDELVNLVSELVVNRSTFEQHFGRLIEEVDELRPSVDRMRRASSKMETQYEVINLGGGKFAGYGKVAVGIPGAQSMSSRMYEFDELEFDRYTEFHLLSRELAETTSDIGAVGNELRYIMGDFDSCLDRQGRLTSEIQDKLMRLRMVPLATLVTRLRRTVRVTAVQQGKTADFMIEGEDVELDKTVLEDIADPLLHILRNSVDHGIEPQDIRKVMGKPEKGQIWLRAYYEGTQVVIQAGDDGAGLDTELLRSAVLRGGFLPESDAMSLSQEELYSLIFLPGFSTAREVSEISGRGVGMDIVKSTVHKMKGTVSVNSTPGKGTTFTVRLPMTLAIMRVLIVKACNETFAVPLGAVTQILRVEKDKVEHLGQELVVRLDGKVYPLIRLGDALNLKQPTDQSAERPPVLVLNLGEKQVALVVDQILEAREVVIKSLGNHLRRVHGITGATLMGDGTVVLILNPGDLAVKDFSRTEFGTKPHSLLTRDHATKELDHGVLDVLIVDDSVSVRRVMSNFIKKIGLNPIVAKDGVDALEVMQRSAKTPGIILLDIEMPRMDGYELTSTLRAQKAFKDIPIVMITSRSGEKHRQKAFELGATEYLVKPYQDEVLMSIIRRLISESRGTKLQ